MIDIDDKIENLKLEQKIIKKLKEKNLTTIKDIWVLKRKELKEKEFNDSEIKSIVIALELEGLDLNKKIYD
ncbi:MAG: hypothetical protein IJZ46_00710 [Bacilli bacterium]|nr:hypothetical protein [Bacilli bacterium]